MATGESAGISLAKAKRVVEEGMDQVFITARRQNALDAGVAETRENVAAAQGEVVALSDRDHLNDAVWSQSRKIDVLFANAGVSQLMQIEAADFDGVAQI